MMVPGTYTITVVTINTQGCSATASTTIVVNSPVIVGGTVMDAACNTNDGVVNSSINSGTAPFSYAWSTGAITPNISGLAPGTYCVTVTDANGCNDSNCFNVSGVNSNPVTITGPGFLCPGETINFSANSSGAVSYAWSATGGNLLNPNAQNTGYQMMMPGTFTITVVATNAQGCTSSSSTDVIVYEPIILGNETITDANCGLSDGAINITTTSGIAPFSYAWSTGATTQNISGLAAGTYCVTINDAVGCHSLTECFDVSGSNASPVTIIGPNTICPGESITLTANSADAVSYVWTATGGTLGSPNSQSTSYTMMTPGTYTITVVSTNSQGCTSSNSVDIIINSPATILAGGTATSCGEDNGALNALATGAGPFTYLWNTGDTTPGIAGLPSGTYCICLLYTSPSPRDATLSRMPSSA